MSTISGNYSSLNFVCGDVTGDFSITSLDASYILKHTVLLSPQYPLMDQDSVAADVTGNGDISAFDATQILKHKVGLPAIMNCAPASAKQAPLLANLEWTKEIQNNEETLVSVPISIKEIEGDINAIEVKIELPDGVKVKGVTQAPENWQIMTKNNEDSFYVTFNGLESFQEGLVGMFNFEITDQSSTINIEAEIRLNESEMK